MKTGHQIKLNILNVCDLKLGQHDLIRNTLFSQVK